MTDEPSHGHDPDRDLPVRLHERLRSVRAGHGELTSRELLELADALTRDREEIGRSLQELRVREAEGDELRRALEATTSAAARELEERNAQLNSLAGELAAERARLESWQAELAARERDLEAVPAPPARLEEESRLPGAVERILEELRSRLEAIEAAVLGGVRRGERGPEAPESEPGRVTAPGHTLFVATASGYVFLERDGDAPALGEQVEVDELRGVATVTGFRGSPLAADRRPCAVCEASADRAAEVLEREQHLVDEA